MKKFLLLPLVLFSAQPFANELNTYTEVSAAVHSGKLIRFAIDFSQCSTAADTLQMQAFGVFTPNEIIIDPRGNILSSLTHFTINNPLFPQRSVYEFVNYTITGTGTVNVSMQVLDAPTYHPISDKFSFSCHMHSGVKIYD